MTRSTRRAGAVCGLVAVLVFVTLYFAAMSLDSEYVFFENYLSDLGVREGAWAFNSGVIVAGILFIIMDVLAVAPALGRGRAAAASVMLLVLAAAFLIGVGVFTEDAGDLHGLVSYGFFLTMLVSFGALSYVLYRGFVLGRRAFIFTLVAFIFGVSLLPFGGTPEVETLAVLGILAWGLAMSFVLFGAASDEETP